ncbi:MAG: multiprotein-bridging factor 1 family protein, partial [Pyrinomonadaceae bacterium]
MVVIFCERGVDMTGHDLRTGREQRGWTQEESASRLGVSQSYL